MSELCKFVLKECSHSVEFYMLYFNNIVTSAKATKSMNIKINMHNTHVHV